jgi:hypothetical protein
MRYGVTISAALHIGLLILAVLGLPSLFDSDRTELVPVNVEVVSEEDLAKTPEPPKPEPPKRAPPKAAPPKAATAAPPPTPAPPPPAPQPAPQVAKLPPPEPIPEKKPPPPKPEAKPEPPPEPEKKPVETAKKTPPAAPAPKPKRKPEPPPDEFDSLLKNLAKDKRRVEQTRKTEAPAPTAARAPETPKRSALQERLAAQKLAALITAQISRCWSIPIGAKDVQGMSVDIRIRMNPDGTYATLPQIRNTARMATDTAFRALAESAVRALRDPACTPLKLPYEDYNDWKDIIFAFTPPN